MVLHKYHWPEREQQLVISEKCGYSSHDCSMCTLTKQSTDTNGIAHHPPLHYVLKFESLEVYLAFMFTFFNIQNFLKLCSWHRLVTYRLPHYPDYKEYLHFCQLFPDKQCILYVQSVSLLQSRYIQNCLYEVLGYL
jgi:hypothetical protein